jgi:hypothetical protein
MSRTGRHSEGSSGPRKCIERPLFEVGAAALLKPVPPQIPLGALLTFSIVDLRSQSPRRSAEMVFSGKLGASANARIENRRGSRCNSRPTTNRAVSFAVYRITSDSTMLMASPCSHLALRW